MPRQEYEEGKLHKFPEIYNFFDIIFAKMVWFFEYFSKNGPIFLNFFETYFEFFSEIAYGLRVTSEVDSESLPTLRKKYF